MYQILSESPEFYKRYYRKHIFFFSLPDSVCMCLSVCLSVCMCVYMSVYNKLTFESLDVRISFLHFRYISGGYSSFLYMKVIGSRSRSHEQKWSKIPIPTK